ncbi:MAG TPA: oligoendopeptidase F [Treponema sp.]|nr:MAG: oligoendopeptidase F [Treponema sp. GWC1_61_84]HCM28405.1 oligoendopeptidase F [Treponema sp.]
MAKTTKIPPRSEVAVADTWNLSALFSADDAWDDALGRYEKLAENIEGYRGTLGASGAALADWLDFWKELSMLEERLSYYSELRQTEDEGASESRARVGRLAMAAAKAQAAAAWATPEIQAIDDKAMERFLDDERIEEYRIYLKKMLRWKAHILSDKEERILALQSEAEGTPREAFSVLTNVDLDFGSVETEDGPLPLSQSTWSSFMEKPDRDLRRRAYVSFYSAYEKHKTTLAALYSGSVKQDVVKARVRDFPSARAMALFGDDVSEDVYDNLVATVNANLAPLHRYYDLRRKALKLDELRHWDVYAPIAPAARKRTSWDEAVELIGDALAPLGNEYVSTLRGGLLGRWADRYENKGKRSGAFSAGSYTGEPYILMNYKDDVIRDVFTLAHEGGHSMHSWYSARSNPFMHYGYTIFEAEVASTFNEELLFRHLEKKAESAELKAWLVNKRIDDLLATLYRQTMFAEYEARTHALHESGTPLTVDVLRGEYRSLLVKYFGPAMKLEEASDMEGLRIPHFYGAFYVYKYATGVSASLALAERVLSGGAKERDDYFAFLKSGGSRFPIEALRVAGVDMASPVPVRKACEAFARMVDELESLIDR